MVAHSILLTNRNLKDLNPLTAGEHICDPGHSFGPAVRKYTLIHYVLSGKGMFYARGGAYPVEAGQAFLILPGEVTTYTADRDDPWHYRWIGFDGELTARFADLPPVFSLSVDIFSKLLRVEEDLSVAEYRISSELFRLYASLFSSEFGQNPYVRRTENHIRTAYMQPIRVEQIAKQLGLDRRYLARLFKAHTGKSMQEFLVDVRMEEGKRLLKDGCSVAEAAQLVGYEDVSNFSKMFKKHYGITPAAVSHKR